MYIFRLHEKKRVSQGLRPLSGGSPHSRKASTKGGPFSIFHVSPQRCSSSQASCRCAYSGEVELEEDAWPVCCACLLLPPHAVVSSPMCDEWDLLHAVVCSATRGESKNCGAVFVSGAYHHTVAVRELPRIIHGEVDGCLVAYVS
eukprot:2284506-Amphidinium_carterae.2